MTIPVSVVLPTYNRAATIIRSVDSVLKQKPALFAVDEVIVVDDGSTDETAALIKRIIDPRVRLVLLGKNQGACYARNYGVSVSKNDFIAFQDSDDVWHEEKLSVLGGFHRTDIDVYFSAFYKVVNGRKQFYPDWLKKSGYREGELIKYSLLRNPVSTSALLVRKKTVQEAGGFDANLRRFQDWELVLRIFDRCPVVFVNQPLVVVEARPDSISRKYCSGIFSRLYILKKHLRMFLRHPFLFPMYMISLIMRAAFVPFKLTARL